MFENIPNHVFKLVPNRISGSLGLLIFALGAPDAPKTLQIWKKTSPRRQNQWKLKPQGLINRCEFAEKSLKSGLDHRCTTYKKYRRMPWDFPNGGPSSKVYIYIYRYIDISIKRYIDNFMSIFKTCKYFNKCMSIFRKHVNISTNLCQYVQQI